MFGTVGKDALVLTSTTDPPGLIVAD